MLINVMNAHRIVCAWMLQIGLCSAAFSVHVSRPLRNNGKFCVSCCVVKFTLFIDMRGQWQKLGINQLFRLNSVRYVKLAGVLYIVKVIEVLFIQVQSCCSPFHTQAFSHHKTPLISIHLILYSSTNFTDSSRFWFAKLIAITWSCVHRGVQYV